MTHQIAETSERTESRRRYWWHIFLILGIAAVLRFWHLDSQPLWMDEIASLNNAELMRTSGLAGIAAQDHVAPLSAVFDSMSISYGGPSAFWLRLPSAVASTIAAAVTYGVAWRLLNNKGIALGAGLFTAVAPFAVWFGQEARMYSLLLLISLIYIGACWGLIDGKHRPRDFLVIALVGALGLWTHHYMALLIATFGVFLAVKLGPRDRRLWLWVASQAVALATFLPWLVLTQGQGNGTGFEKSGQVLWLPYTFFSELAGMSLGPSTRDLRTLGTSQALWQSAPAVALTLAALIAICLVGLPVLWRLSKTTAAWVLCWGCVPPALAIALTFVMDVSYNARYAITAFPAIAILVGAAVSRVGTAWRSKVALVLTAGVVALSISNWYSDPRYGKDDLRSPAAVIAQQMSREDVLVVDNAHALPSLSYYGWRCKPSDVVVNSGQGAASAGKELATRRPVGSTWLLIFRPWETDSGGLLQSGLGDNGAVVGAWPGSTLIRYEGTADMSPSEGVTVGCTR